MTKQGLGAAGFLLLAEGHLRKAREVLEQGPKTRRRYGAKCFTIDATRDVRHALCLLKEEEPCKP